MDRSKWYFNAVSYQIYPQSFFDTNGDGIGDLNGIIEKLDYVKSLGVDAIWINSLFESYSFKDAGYDIVDHKSIAPRYGDLSTFDRLVEKAHRKGLRVIGEMNFACTSNEHPWFIESRKMERNKYSNWYVWSRKPIMYNEVQNIMGMRGGSWVHFEAERYDSYYVGWLPFQPWLNFGVPSLEEENANTYDHPDLRALRQELRDVVRFWLDRGVDGFRADTVENLCVYGPGVHENTMRFWKEIRSYLDEKSTDLAFIGEGWLKPADCIKNCLFKGSFYPPPFLDPTNVLRPANDQMQFFSPQGGDIKCFVDDYLVQHSEAVKHSGLLNLISGNHDVSRMREYCQKDEIASCYFAFLLTFPTAPFIYYGDEIGLSCPTIIASKEGAGPRARSRTPMQWNDANNAGFSNAEVKRLYYPICADYQSRNVEMQARAPRSILNTVRRLVEIRKAHMAFKPFAGMRNLHLHEGDKSYIYSRYTDDEAFVIALNPSDAPRVIAITLAAAAREFSRCQSLSPVLCASKCNEIKVRNSQITMDLPRNFYGIYRVES